MAHNLDTIRTGALAGKAAFATVKEPAWHELGQVVQNPLTVEEALYQAGLDFEVARTPVIFEPDRGAKAGELGLVMPDKFVNYRLDTGEGLGIVGSRYTILQNAEALSFFDSIIGERSAVIETAGVLYGGRRVFVSARMPEHIHVPGDGAIKNYILLFNSHDGSTGIMALITPVRVVCNNTLIMALRESTNRVVLRHTASARERLAQAAELLGIYDQLKRELEKSLTRMTEKAMGEKQVDKLLNRLFLTPSEYQDLNSEKAVGMRALLKDYIYGESGGQQTHPGTAYQFYNGVTGYFQNVKNYRSTQSKVEHSLFGTDARIMERAFQLAIK